MSEKKPFDVAIAVLKTELQECSPDEEDEFCDFIQSLTDNQYEKGLRIALRVLKAAGKVNKTRAIQGLKNMENIGDFFPNEWSVPLGFEELLSQNKESAKEIRALLESLPDKEEK